MQVFESDAVHSDAQFAWMILTCFLSFELSTMAAILLTLGVKATAGECVRPLQAKSRRVYLSTDAFSRLEQYPRVTIEPKQVLCH